MKVHKQRNMFIIALFTTAILALWTFESSLDSAGFGQWAKSVIEGSNESEFKSIAVDIDVNIYAAGYQKGNGFFTYGDGVRVKGACKEIYCDNAVLVKYAMDGKAQWARSVQEGSRESRFYSIAVDPAGNIYAVGYQRGNDSFTYGDGVHVKGTNKSTNRIFGKNAVLVKYAMDGRAQWAKSVSEGSNDTSFHSVAVDPAGNIYAVGYQRGNDSFTYGDSVRMKGSGKEIFYTNVVLVKYSPDGRAQWAKSVIEGSNHSAFNSVAVDRSGNIYVVGNQKGNGFYTYGEGVRVKGVYAGDYNYEKGKSYIIGTNAILVKYAPDGRAQWAKGVIEGSNSTTFNSVAIDSSGNIYAAGDQGGGFFTYSEGVSLKSNYGSFAVLVKYAPDGRAQWAKFAPEASNASSFDSIAINSSGKIYAAGYLRRSFSKASAIVKYTPDGSVEGVWRGRVSVRGTIWSHFKSVSVDVYGNIYASGYQHGDALTTDVEGMSEVGVGKYNNAVIVKYFDVRERGI